MRLGSFDAAWEIDEIIMKKPRIKRRLTRELVRHPWKRILTEDLRLHAGHEWYDITALGVGTRKYDKIIDELTED